MATAILEGTKIGKIGTEYKVADLGLADWGRKEIEIAELRVRMDWSLRVPVDARDSGLVRARWGQRGRSPEKWVLVSLERADDHTACWRHPGQHRIADHRATRLTARRR